MSGTAARPPTSSGVLAGWSPGVGLDDTGRAQATALAARLAALPLAAVVCCPLQRCQETVDPLLDTRPELPLHTDDRVGECHYGDWTGRKLSELAEEPLWATVQRHPSAAVFPGPEGESLRAMQARAVDAVRDWDQRIEAEHGPDALYLVCSHGDIIKALAADALGMHLDLFQRISADPCSVTVDPLHPAPPVPAAARRHRRPHRPGPRAAEGSGRRPRRTAGATPSSEAPRAPRDQLPQ